MIAAIAQSNVEVTEYLSMCDASAALALDEEHFVIANDEDNVLRIFSVDRQEPVQTFDLSAFLGIRHDSKSSEADLEGAAKLGDYYFFISSHGRDAKGRLRENRHCFFAIQVDKRGNDFVIRPVGRVYKHLLDDLVAVEGLKKIGLPDLYQPKVPKNEQLEPKHLGVNIEGLSVAADGKSLLIGFRNPIPNGKAILIALNNPLPVVLTGAAPSFSSPIFLNLNGLGIRSIDYLSWLDRYLIIAGARDGSEKSRLFYWSGLLEGVHEFEQQVLLTSWNPETFSAFPERSRIQLYSDDGTRLLENAAGERCECKKLPEPERKRFRGLWVDMP
jgi:hypothetical protein